MVVVTLFLTVMDKSNESKSTTEKCSDKETEAGKLEVGSCAPNFRLPDLKGEEKELYANNQKPTFVNFWATWCGPCQSELPHIEAAYKKYKDKVNFMMVNATGTEPNEKDVANFMKRNQYTFPVVLDRRDTNITFGKYKLVGIPVTLAIDQQGQIVFKRVGSVSEKEMKQLMEKLVN